MKLLKSIMFMLFIGLPFSFAQASTDLDDVTMDVVHENEPDEVVHDIELPHDADIEGREDDHKGYKDTKDDHDKDKTDDHENEMDRGDDKDDDKDDGRDDDKDDMKDDSRDDDKDDSKDDMKDDMKDDDKDDNKSE